MYIPEIIEAILRYRFVLLDPGCEYEYTWPDALGASGSYDLS
jgi:hypothetical protein